MTWEWSYTQEGIEGIQDQIYKQPRLWLEQCWAEIQAAIYPPEEDNYGQEPEFDEEKYEAALTQAKSVFEHHLADAIFEFARQRGECTNGGWEVYCCPWSCHKVTPGE